MTLNWEIKLTEGTSVKSEKERTQYRALGDTERWNYSLRETIQYILVGEGFSL